MSTISALPALAFVSLLSLAVPTSTFAAPASSTKVAEVIPPVRPSVVAEGEDDSGSCSRIRRRLWVEGEGWVVRRVTTCR